MSDSDRKDITSDSKKMQTETDFFYGVKKAEAVQQFLQEIPSTELKQHFTAKELHMILENWQEHSLKSLSCIFSRLWRSGANSKMKAYLVQAYSRQMNELIEIHLTIQKKIVTLCEVKMDPTIDSEGNTTNLAADVSQDELVHIALAVERVIRKISQLQNFVDKQRIFAAVQGVLIGARIIAIPFPEGTGKNSMEALLNNIQVMPNADQEKFILSLEELLNFMISRI